MRTPVFQTLHDTARQLASRIDAIVSDADQKTAVRKLRRFAMPALWVAMGAACVAYTTMFGQHILDVFSIEHYFRGLNCDDSFYYNKIALNFANGLFSTFDGLNRSNGYHPLWMAMLIPVYLLEGDLLEALTLIKVVEFVLIGAALVTLLAAALAGKIPPLFLLPIPPLILADKTFYHGMESGLLLLLLCLLWLSMALCIRRTTSRGALIFLTTVLVLIPWARLEAVSVSLFVPFALLVGARFKVFDLPVKPMAAVFGIALGSFLVYLLYNYLVFDIAVPVSGVTKAKIFCARLLEKNGGVELDQNLLRFFNLRPYQEGLIVSGVLISLVGLKLVLFKLKRLRIGIAGIDVLMTSFAVGHLALFLHSVVALCPAFSNYPRYFILAKIMEILLVPYLVYTAYRFLSKIPGFGKGGVRGVVVFVIAMALFVQTDYQKPFQMVDRKARQTRMNWGVADYYGAQILSAAMTPKDIIGSNDSGILGYFTTGRLINLDGLVNSADFYRSARHDRLGDWIGRSRITYFANLMRTNHKSAQWFFGKAHKYKGGLPGTAQIVYEGIPAYGKKRQFRIWRYSPQIVDELPLEQNKARFFSQIFKDAVMRRAPGRVVFLTKNVAGVKLTKCALEKDRPKIIARVFPVDVGDINVTLRSRGFKEMKSTLPFEYQGSCYHIIPLGTYEKQKIIVMSNARPPLKRWGETFDFGL